MKHSHQRGSEEAALTEPRKVLTLSFILGIVYFSIALRAVDMALAEPEWFTVGCYAFASTLFLIGSIATSHGEPVSLRRCVLALPILMAIGFWSGHSVTGDATGGIISAAVTIGAFALLFGSLNLRAATVRSTSI